MKKLIAVFIISVMTLTLAGCKKDTSVQTGSENTSSTEVSKDLAQLKPEDGAKLKFWTRDIAFSKEVATLFEAKYGVPVLVEEAGLDAYNKMVLDGPGGTGADIVVIGNDMFLNALDSGIIAEVNPAIADSLKKDIREVALKTVTKDGKIYGFPLSIETSALLYNKNLVKGEPASTFEQIQKEAKEYNNPANNKFWFTTIPTNGYAAYPFLSSSGYSLFGSDGLDSDNPGFDTPAFEKGLEVVASLKEILPIKSGDLTMDSGTFFDQLFIDGKTAYLPVGPWAIKKMKDSGVNFGITTIPTYGGKAMTPFSGVLNIHVSTYSKYPIAAQMFAEFAVSHEAAELLYKKDSKITARKDISTVDGLKDDVISMTFAKQFENAVPMPGSKRMSYFWEISTSVLSAVYDGTITPAEGAKKAQNDFNALVKSE